jgi:hypothetical protein
VTDPDPRDPNLDRAYRETSRDEPPPGLDERIRAAARRAIGTRPKSLEQQATGVRRRSWASRWRVPLSVAATLIIAATLTVMVQDEERRPRDDAGRGVSPMIVPAREAEKPAPPASAPTLLARAPGSRRHPPRRRGHCATVCRAGDELEERARSADAPAAADSAESARRRMRRTPAAAPPPAAPAPVPAPPALKAVPQTARRRRIRGPAAGPQLGDRGRASREAAPSRSDPEAWVSTSATCGCKAARRRRRPARRAPTRVPDPPRSPATPGSASFQPACPPREHVMNRSVAAVAAFCLASTALPAAAGELVDVAVVSRATGSARPSITIKAGCMSPARRGRYAVCVANRTGGGCSRWSRSTASTRSLGKPRAPTRTAVLAAHQSFEIAGWRKSTSEVAAFYFTQLPDSYAARTDRPDNVGVIGVAVFREFRPPRPAVLPQPRPYARSDDAAREAESSAADAAGAPAASARENAPEGARCAAGEIGTGHGERERSDVVYTVPAGDELPTRRSRSTTRANLVAAGSSGDGAVSTLNRSPPDGSSPTRGPRRSGPVLRERPGDVLAHER